MEQGPLGELYLTRSVTKHIRKHNKEIQFGGATLNDCALLSLDETRLVSTEGWGTNPYLAWVKAMNNLATSGAIPIGVRILMMFPEGILEETVKGYMSEFNKLADEFGIQIMGGHTQISEAYATPTFTVTALGQCKEYFPEPKKIEAGDKVIMTKWVGVLGSDIIAKQKADVLSGRLSRSYIEGGIFGEDKYQVWEEGRLLSKLSHNVLYMHDVSSGGVYAGLWQLGSRIGKGLKIKHFDIPIKQETIEFCEVLDINPYMLEGTGAMLAVARDGKEAVNALQKAGINAAIIGEVTQGKERIVTLSDGGEKRFLAPAKGDEIYKVVSLY